MIQIHAQVYGITNYAQTVLLCSCRQFCLSAMHIGVLDLSPLWCFDPKTFHAIDKRFAPSVEHFRPSVEMSLKNAQNQSICYLTSGRIAVLGLINYVSRALSLFRQVKASNDASLLYHKLFFICSYSTSLLLIQPIIVSLCLPWILVPFCTQKGFDSQHMA